MILFEAEEVAKGGMLRRRTFLVVELERPGKTLPLSLVRLTRRSGCLTYNVLCGEKLVLIGILAE